MEIDYSGVTPPQVQKASTWKPPRHVYFGKKDPETGQMEDEPVYSYQEFPRFMYKLAEGKVSAKLAQNAEERDAFIADGFVKSLAELGVITAPSIEQMQKPKTLSLKKDV